MFLHEGAPTFVFDTSGPVSTGWDPGGTWWLIEDADLGLLIVERSGGSVNDSESDDQWVDERLTSLQFLDNE